jgi:hypothetical protein
MIKFVTNIEKFKIPNKFMYLFFYNALYFEKKLLYLQKNVKDYGSTIKNAAFLVGNNRNGWFAYCCVWNNLITDQWILR